MGFGSELESMLKWMMIFAAIGIVISIMGGVAGALWLFKHIAFV